MKILEQKGNLTKAQIFNMTEGGTSGKVSELVGEVTELNGFILYETEDSEGKVVEALTIITPSGESYSTISPTFIKQFKRINDYMGEEPFNIKVISGTSKNNREFVTCEVLDK